jgi:hypothetical protein
MCLRLWMTCNSTWEYAWHILRQCSEWTRKGKWNRFGTWRQWWTPMGLRYACQLLYLGVWSSKLATTMLLMNVCIVHGINNKCVDELLSLLHKYLLPLGNYLTTNMCHAKALTHKVGLSYKLIHACQNGCVVSRCMQNFQLVQNVD